jgi:hypothetical protein
VGASVCAAGPDARSDSRAAPIESYRDKQECLSAGILTINRIEQDAGKMKDPRPRFAVQCVPVYSKPLDAMAN